MSSRPVYRYPPRSHVYNCPCPRCAQCRSRPLQSGAWIWPLLAVLGAVSWAACAVACHPLQTAAAGAGIVFLALVTWAVVFLNRRAARPPKGRLRVEATTPGQLRPPPASVCVPRCLHLNAVRVESEVAPDVTLENLCPDCDTQLGVGFRWSCCSAPPRTSPGDGHLYNCPHRKEQS